MIRSGMADRKTGEGGARRLLSFVSWFSLVFLAPVLIDAGYLAGGVCAAEQGAPPVSFDTAACRAYVDRFRGRLESAWLLPDGKNRVTITCSVDRDGAVSDLVTTSSPSSAEAETAANDAFIKCQPLEPLPADTKGSARLTAVFSSSSDPHGSSNSSLSVRLDPPAVAPAK